MELICHTCRLRRLEKTDVESLAVHGNDPDVWRNLRDRFPHPYHRADAEQYVTFAASLDPLTSFAIAVDGPAVGVLTLTRGHDIERVSAEIGYWLGRAFWGRGIMSEAVEAATRYAFETLDVRRVFAVPFVENRGSRRVLEKAGYVLEGTMRRSAIKEGQLRDQYLYAAYDDTWFRSTDDAAARTRA